MNLTEESLKNLFSRNMQVLMALDKISETHLSLITNISQSAINRIKNGTVCPSLYQALLIAKTLNKNIDYFLTNNPQEESTINYCPIIESTSNKKKNSIVGFIKHQEEWRENTIGIKYDKNFNCKLLGKNSVVMLNIPINDNYIEGDTVCCIYKKKFIIGTISKSLIKPIDNLLLKINIDEVNTVGHVISIENTYLKDKKLLKEILSSYSTSKLTNLVFPFINKVTESFA